MTFSENGAVHRLTACICCAGVPAWASPHFHLREYATVKTSYTRETLSDILWRGGVIWHNQIRTRNWWL